LGEILDLLREFFDLLREFPGRSQAINDRKRRATQ